MVNEVYPRLDHGARCDMWSCSIDLQGSLHFTSTNWAFRDVLGTQGTEIVMAAWIDCMRDPIVKAHNTFAPVFDMVLLLSAAAQVRDVISKLIRFLLQKSDLSADRDEYMSIDHGPRLVPSASGEHGNESACEDRVAERTTCGNEKNRRERESLKRGILQGRLCSPRLALHRTYTPGG
jgi:hypothetical protein